MTHVWQPPPEPAAPATATAPPPAPGEDDAAADARWSAWQGLAAFVTAVGAILVLGGLVLGVVAAAFGTDLDDPPPAVAILGVLVQDAVLIGVTLAFASMSARPRAPQFGLRRTRFWPTVGWAAAGLGLFIVLNLVYTGVVDPEGEQSVADDLGVNDSTAALIAGGFVVIVLAPVVEELFFRGFFYSALRNSFARGLGRGGGVALAVLANGAIFGAIHYTGRETLEIIPVLAMLGAVFCLVYEVTRSLWSVIALHALVNTIAYAGVADDGAGVALAFGAATLAACAVLPRVLDARARPAA